MIAVAKAKNSHPTASIPALGFGVRVWCKSVIETSHGRLPFNKSNSRIRFGSSFGCAVNKIINAAMRLGGLRPISPSRQTCYGCALLRQCRHTQFQIAFPRGPGFPVAAFMGLAAVQNLLDRLTQPKRQFRLITP